jgi:hypothetical protein
MDTVVWANGFDLAPELLYAKSPGALSSVIRAR